MQPTKQSGLALHNEFSADSIEGKDLQHMLHPSTNLMQHGELGPKVHERAEGVFAVHVFTRRLKFQRTLFAILLDDGLIFCDILGGFLVRHLAFDALLNARCERHIRDFSLGDLCQSLHRLLVEMLFAERRH